MTKRDVATIGCRLLAIYCLISALGLSGGFYQASVFIATTLGVTIVNSGAHSWFIALAAFGPCVLQLVFGVFLWMFSDGVGAIVAGEERGARAVAAWDKHDFKSVVLFVMGLYFLVASLPGVAQFVANAYQFFLTPNSGPLVAGGMGFMWPSLARVIVEMLCGMVLLISAHFMSRRGAADEESEQ